MKRMSAFWLTVLLFGLINGYDVISRFGWVAVDRPPMQLFLINLWTSVRNVIGYTLAPSALVFLCGRKSRWLLVPAFAFMLGVEAASVFSQKIFHASLAGNWIALITNTSCHELLNFIIMSMNWLVAFALIAFVLIVAGYAVAMKCASYPGAEWKNKLIGVGLVCPLLVTNVLLMNWHAGLGQTVWSAFVITSYGTWKNMQGVIRACDHPNLRDKLETSVPRELLPDVIIVIGESSSRNNWSLYGYPRQTTPRMEALCREGQNGIAFRDVVGIQPITVGAVGDLLTDTVYEDKQRGNWTLAEVYRRAGYRCVLISNQLIGEKDTSLLARLYNGCEKRICPRCRLPEANKYDEYMLPFVKEELSTRDDRPLALFVHLTGMHFPVHDVNPPADDFFNDNVDSKVLEGLSVRDRDRRNRYDNGIRYEDKVLGMIVDALTETKRASVLFYITDHGESPRSPEWRNYEDVDVYELPCVMWFSDTYVERFPDLFGKAKAASDRSLQPDQMTTGLVAIGLICRDESFDRSFLDDEFRCRSPRVINKGRCIYQAKRNKEVVR